MKKQIRKSNICKENNMEIIPLFEKDTNKLEKVFSVFIK